MISERTRAALAVRKGQGALLGNRTNLAEAQAAGAASTAAEARRFAENVVPVIHQIRSSGVASLRGIASVLNTRGVRTARGGKWQATQVGTVLARAAEAAFRTIMLFITGYAHKATVDQGAALEPGMALINKLFALASLANKVRDMIES